MSGEHTWRGARPAFGWSSIAMLAGLGLLAGCFADSSDHTTTSTGSGGGGGYASSSGGSAQVLPLVVQVDTNATLVTTPGNGIGVYVEYESGGHWSVSWTCDTALTGLSCNFVVDASVAAPGTITDTNNTVSSGDTVTQASPTQIEAVTLTTNEVDGMTFDTAPGALVTVSVSLNAPVSFFFVQSNKVNGDYTGPLPNPLIFEPKSP